MDGRHDEEISGRIGNGCRRWVRPRVEGGARAVRATRSKCQGSVRSGRGQGGRRERLACRGRSRENGGEQRRPRRSRRSRRRPMPPAGAGRTTRSAPDGRAVGGRNRCAAPLLATAAGRESIRRGWLRSAHVPRVAARFLRGLERDVRHPARPHPAPRQAGGGAGPTRTGAAACRAASHRAGLGDGPAARTRRLGRPGRGARPADPRGGGRAPRRADTALRARSGPAGRRSDTERPRSGPRAGGTRRDQSDSPGGVVDGSSRRRRAARPLRTRPGRGLLRCGDPGCLGARSLPCSVPWTVDTGQCLVGVFRPGGQSLLRPSGRPTLRRLHHAQRDGLPGGRRGLVAGRPAVSQGCLLRLCAPRARGIRIGVARPGHSPLGRRVG